MRRSTVLLLLTALLVLLSATAPLQATPADARGSGCPAGFFARLWSYLNFWPGLGADPIASMPAREEGGPHVDPNGASSPTGEDGGPHVDPNGFASPPGNDVGPEVEPGGLVVGRL